MSVRVVRCLMVALAVLPMAAAVAYITSHGQPVPFYDEWSEPVDNAIKTAEGTLTVADLVRQYNDSRPVFTNLLTVTSTLLLDWDVEAEMLFNQLVAAITLLLLFLILWRQVDEWAYAMVPVMSVIAFSLTQRQNLVWAIQSQYYFLILFAVASVWVLGATGRGWRAISLAALFSAGATFSFANGLLVWFVMAVVLWFAGYRAPRYLLFWLASSAAGIALFTRGYTFRPNLGGVPEPGAVVEFVLAFLGNALVGHHGPTSPGRIAAIAAVGAAGLALLVTDAFWLGRRTRRPEKWAVWVSLAGFVVASCVLAAVARLESKGLATALANRYVTLSLLFWIAVAGLSAATVRQATAESRSERSARAITLVNVLVGAALLGLLVLSNVRSLSVSPRVTRAHRECLERAPVTRDVSCLAGLHPVFEPDNPSYQWRHLALEKIDRLAALELGVFSRSDQSRPSPAAPAGPLVSQPKP